MVIGKVFHKTIYKMTPTRNQIQDIVKIIEKMTKKNIE